MRTQQGQVIEVLDLGRFFHKHQVEVFHTPAELDRLGSGDAFAGALIYCLLSEKGDQEALDFATAASALKHSIQFDLNLINVEEVESLVRDGGAGRVQR